LGLSSLGDPCQDQLQIPEDLLVTEAEKFIAILFQLLSPCVVGLLMPVVTWAIELDYQSSRKADKVENERSDGVLAPELEAGQLALAEGRPENPFRGSHAVSQLASC